MKDRRRRQFTVWTKEIVQDNKLIIQKAMLVFLLLGLSWGQLQFSCIYHSIWELGYMKFKYILLNLATEGALLALLYALLDSLWCSCTVYTGFFFWVSVINYYTIQLHDAPFTIAALGNWKTAADVLNGYHLKLGSSCLLYMILGAECFITYKIKSLSKRSEKGVKARLKTDAFLTLTAIMIFYFGYFSQKPFMSKRLWSWVADYQTYGYIACTIKAAQETYDVVKRPEGYDVANVEDVKRKEILVPGGETPDIFLILNETFYDLSILVDIKTDVPYLENIQSMKNVIKGYAVNPAGGTNPSEYELLTSNSMKLMHGIYPFNSLDMQGANSIVSYLKQLGYTTTGAHCGTPENYNRNRAYPAIGFDNIYFRDDFIDKEYFGSRNFATDISLYKNILSWYRDSSEETPQFFYLLTIQNHGGWDMNSSELDTVHVQGDWGGYKEQIEEYLSCIRLSDQAFKDFTDELETFDRKIIVCMVGDHGPAMTGKIAKEPESQETLLLRTSVPFVIWTNFAIEDTAKLDGKTISMNYLVPALLKTANMNLSIYYQKMLELEEKVPILTAYSGYYDRYDILHAYDEQNEYTEVVNNYFYMEYNNLQKDRVQALFEPVISGSVY